MVLIHRLCSAALLAILLTGYGCDVSSSANNNKKVFTQQEINAGGATTVHGRTFSKPAANLDAQALEKHNSGDASFENSFVTAPSFINGGLGPLFNNSECDNCHVNDGAGRPFLDDGRISSVLVRLSKKGDISGKPQPVPGYGTQLQNHATVGKRAEGSFKVNYKDTTVKFGDGTKIILREPEYQVINLYKPIPKHTAFSVRTAPPIFGMGLLGAIPATQIKAHADPDDADNDGISGRPNMVYNDSTNRMELGRFGWKANQPTVMQQVAIAYQQDMGISSLYYPEDNPYKNPEAQDSLDDDPEISQKELENTAFYASTLAVPAKRNTDSPEVARGEKLFKQAGCQSCHISTYKTKADADIAALANQTIHPYTDLLLHDMGKGLADHRSDFKATGREWRTAPLWGIGLMQEVNGHTDLLHDGRARSIMEAIMWHGGEAKQAQEFVKELSKSDRNALVAFVNAI